MNVITGKQPLQKFTNLKGTFSRGSSETCPADHFEECYNCIFTPAGEVTIREPVTIQSNTSFPGSNNIVSFFIAQISSGARLLVLLSTGALWDATTSTLLYTAAGADDFAAINAFGRTYLSFKSNGVVLNGYVLFYYDGTNFRQAAGSGPGAGLALAQVNPGVVDPGVHHVAVAFVTSTGYISNPGPSVAITSAGAKDIELSSIPVAPGGSGVVSKVLLMSPAGQTELFFVPGGTIANATTTATINVSDTALIVSADYLNDIYATFVPSPNSIRFYRGRLVLIGCDGAPDNILVSRVSDPETFDKVNGVIHLPADYVSLNVASTGLVIRDTLYLMKPNATYSCQDNGGDPSTWPVTIIDSGLGSWDNGVSLFSNALSGTDVQDSSFVASPRGLMIFDGTYNASITPLSWKIDGIWRLIDPTYFWKVQVAHDVWKKRVYVLVPLASQLPTFGLTQPFVTGSLYVILMMDYQDGLDPQSVKWSVWTSASFGNPISDVGVKKMSMENFTLVYPPPTGVVPIYQLAFCNGSSYMYKITLPQNQLFEFTSAFYIPDNVASILSPIKQYVTFPPICPGDGIYTWIMLNFSMTGYGLVGIQLAGKYSSSIVSITGFQLDNYIGQAFDFQRGINFTSESLRVVLKCFGSVMLGGIQPYFQINQLSVYGNKMWNMRPALLEFP